jgi:hypothetical protein
MGAAGAVPLPVRVERWGGAVLDGYILHWGLTNFVDSLWGWVQECRAKHPGENGVRIKKGGGVDETGAEL